MAVYKNENTTVSLLPEDNGYALAPSTYAGAKAFQVNSGTFNASRNALESQARTPNAELAGVRLGNKQVAGSFPVEIDPKNYQHLLESLFYGRFTAAGTEVALTAVDLSATKAYELVIPMTSGEQTTLGASIGDPVRIHSADTDIAELEGGAVLVSATGTDITLMVPDQNDPAFSKLGANLTVAPMQVLRPAKQELSFNAEESLFAEDGVEESRFMTTGAIVSGGSFEMPSEGLITTTFSFIGSAQLVSAQYSVFDPALTDSTAAHTAVVPHTKYDPMVLQDGAIVDDKGEVLCQLLSATLNIENGAQTFYTGCSYEARGAFSGDFAVTLDTEVLFQSEQDYIDFESEESRNLLIRLNVRDSDECIVINIPSLRKVDYQRNDGDGLVTANVTARAVVSDTATNSLILGVYAA